MRELLLTALLLGTAALPLSAAVPGHFAPAVLNVRDYFLPEKGLYGVLYAPYYHAAQVHDGEGNRIDALTVQTKNGPATLAVGASVDALLLAPTLVWSTDLEFWQGARLGAEFSPTFANANQGVELQSQTSVGASGRRSQFALGDWYIQPFWADWLKQPIEASLSYGLYMPTGKFDVRTVTLPNGAELRGPAPGGTGLGYWESQFQGAFAWYPKPDKSTAVSFTGTYEIPGKQRNLDSSPGSYFTAVWGVSQYLPLGSKDTLLELGPAGYAQWQLNADHGSDVRFDALAHVYAAGVQVGVTFVPKSIAVNVRYFNEFKAAARLQGETVSASVGAKFL